MVEASNGHQVVDIVSPRQELLISKGESIKLYQPLFANGDAKRVIQALLHVQVFLLVLTNCSALAKYRFCYTPWYGIALTHGINLNVIMPAPTDTLCGHKIPYPYQYVLVQAQVPRLSTLFEIISDTLCFHHSTKTQICNFQVIGFSPRLML